MRRFWDAAVELDPSAAELDEGRRFPIAAPAPLATAWVDAGLAEVLIAPLDVPTRFADFDDLWLPFTVRHRAGARLCRGLPPDRRDALRERLRSTLPTGPEGTIDLIARAWAIRGRTPAAARLTPFDRPARPGRRDGARRGFRRSPHWGHGPHPHARPGRPPATRPRATSSTPSSRSRPSSSATTALPRRHDPRAEAAGHRGAPPRRQPPGRGRRPGLDGDGAGPRPRAAGPGDRRPVELHPGRLQRARPLHAGAAPPVPRPEPPRRAQRQLRDHRAGPGLRRADARLDRGPRRRPPGSASSTGRSGSSPARRTRTS